MNDLSKYMNKDALHYDVRGAVSKSKWSDYKGKKNIENDGNALLTVDSTNDLIKAGNFSH